MERKISLFIGAAVTATALTTNFARAESLMEMRESLTDQSGLLQLNSSVEVSASERNLYICRLDDRIAIVKDFDDASNDNFGSSSITFLRNGEQIFSKDFETESINALSILALDYCLG